MTLAEALTALSPGGELDAEVVRANQQEMVQSLAAANEARELIMQAQEDAQCGPEGRKAAAHG